MIFGRDLPRVTACLAVRDTGKRIALLDHARAAWYGRFRFCLLLMDGDPSESTGRPLTGHPVFSERIHAPHPERPQTPLLAHRPGRFLFCLRWGRRTCRNVWSIGAIFAVMTGPSDRPGEQHVSSMGRPVGVPYCGYTSERDDSVYAVGEHRSVWSIADDTPGSPGDAPVDFAHYFMPPLYEYICVLIPVDRE